MLYTLPPWPSSGTAACMCTQVCRAGSTSRPRRTTTVCDSMLDRTRPHLPLQLNSNVAFRGAPRVLLPPQTSASLTAAVKAVHIRAQVSSSRGLAVTVATGATAMDYELQLASAITPIRARDTISSHLLVLGPPDICPTAYRLIQTPAYYSTRFLGIRSLNTYDCPATALALRSL